MPFSATLVIGSPAAYPDHADNAWPSDHAAVVAEFDVAPTATVDGREPALALDRTTYGPGDPIVATVTLGPGNATDWIGIYRGGDAPGTQSSVDWRNLDGTQIVRRRGRTTATVSFSAGTLAPGDYVAHFLYADGFGTLTPGTAFNVAP